MKDLFVMVLQIVGFACLLGLIGWFFNYFLGFSVGFKGVKVPTEPLAGLSFFVVSAVCFGLGYLLGRGKSQNKPD
jgi:hypothetical protein